MKIIVKLEYLSQFLLIIFVYFSFFKFSWIYFFLFLLAPDLLMIAYLFNNVVGAYVYNTFHNLVLPCILFILACMISSSIFIMTALIWFAHIFMDRLLGYGLKHTSGFRDTHLS